MKPFRRLLLVTAALLQGVQLYSQTAPAGADAASAKKDDIIQLNPFQVTAAPSESYSSASGTSVGRINQKLEDIPQKVDIYTAAFLHDVQPTTMQDALRFDSAVTFNNSQFNGVSAQVRGFDTAVAGILRNGVKISSAGGLGSVLGVEALDQVEVVKGAAGVLYGPSQPGGVINYITKQPSFEPQTTGGITFFSEGGYGATVDVTGPAPIKSADGHDVFAYRVVGAHVGRGLYQINNQTQQRDLLYAAFTYKPFRDLTIDGNWEYDRQKESFFNAQLLPQAEVTALGNSVTGTLQPSQAPLPYDIYPVGWTYEDTNSFLKEYDKVVQVSATLGHNFGKLGSWAFRMNYVWSETSLLRVLDDISAANNPRPVTTADIGKVVNFTDTVTANDVAAGRLWIPARFLRKLVGFPEATMTTQWDLTGKFSTGPVTHTLLIGSDMNLGTDYKSPPGVVSIESQAQNNAAGNGNAIWVDHPDLRPITNYNYLDTQTEFRARDGGVTRTTVNPSGTVTQIIAMFPSTTPQNNIHYFGVPILTVPAGGNYDKPIYFFDAASLLDGRLQLSAGARHDTLGQNVSGTIFTASQWTYRYGVVAKLLPQLHVFAIHSESFNPNPPAASAALGYYVRPQKGIQNEVGIRVPLLNNRVDIEASVYKITVSNVVQTNPFGNVGVIPPIPANNYAFVPGINDNGFDLSAKVNLVNNLQLTASYTHSTETNASGPAQLALGIANYPVNNQPKDQVAVFGKYQLPVDALRGVHVLAGYTWTGRRPAGAVGALPSLYLNAYGVASAGVGYTRGRWSIDLMITNLFNKYAFRTAPAANRLYPEEPRQATLAVKVKF